MARSASVKECETCSLKSVSALCRRRSRLEMLKVDEKEEKFRAESLSYNRAISRDPCTDQDITLISKTQKGRTDPDLEG